MRLLIAIGFVLFVGCAARELIIEKSQLSDVKENVIKDETIVKIDTLPSGMIKIKYKD